MTGHQDDRLKYKAHLGVLIRCAGGFAFCTFAHTFKRLSLFLFCFVQQQGVFSTLASRANSPLLFPSIPQFGKDAGPLAPYLSLVWDVGPLSPLNVQCNSGIFSPINPHQSIPFLWGHEICQIFSPSELLSPIPTQPKSTTRSVGFRKRVGTVYRCYGSGTSIPPNKDHEKALEPTTQQHPGGLLGNGARWCFFTRPPQQDSGESPFRPSPVARCSETGVLRVQWKKSSIDPKWRHWPESPFGPKNRVGSDRNVVPHNG